MRNKIEYWKELMAVLREARTHYAQIASFSLAAIVAALTIAFTMKNGEGDSAQEKAKLVLLFIATVGSGSVSYMHLIFLKELKILKGQLQGVQPKIGNGYFDVTYAIKKTIQTSLIVFVSIFIGLLYLLFDLTFYI